MALKKAVLHGFDHHALVETGGVQVCGLLGLQQLGVQRLGRDQKAQPQAGREGLGERPHVDAAAGVARGQRQGRRRIKPQVAVGVVFHDGQTQTCGGGAQCHATRLAHAAAGRVLEVGQYIQKARTGCMACQVGDVHAFIVAGHADYMGLHRREGLQRAQIGRCFHQHLAARVYQYFGNQIETLLRAGGDQDLRRINLPGQHGGHHLAQRRKALAGGVLQRGVTVFAQDLVAGFAKGADWKGFGRRQTAREADDAGLFGDFQDLADHRRVHFCGALRLRPLHITLLLAGHKRRPRSQNLC